MTAIHPAAAVLTVAGFLVLAAYIRHRADLYTYRYDITDRSGQKVSVHARLVIWNIPLLDHLFRSEARFDLLEYGLAPMIHARGRAAFWSPLKRRILRGVSEIRDVETMTR